MLYFSVSLFHFSYLVSGTGSVLDSVNMLSLGWIKPALHLVAFCFNAWKARSVFTFDSLFVFFFYFVFSLKMRWWINLCTPSGVSRQGLSGHLTSHRAQRTGSRAQVRPVLNVAGRDLSWIELGAKKSTTERNVIAGGLGSVKDVSDAYCFTCSTHCTEMTWSMFIFCTNREFRRRIRLCCDELNLLVPFCYADTDKATTLQWTTAFLKYIQEIHGDRLKQVLSIMSLFSFQTSVNVTGSYDAFILKAHSHQEW